MARPVSDMSVQSTFVQTIARIALSSWGHLIAAAIAIISIRLYTERLSPDAFGLSMLFVGALALADSMISQPAAQTILSLSASDRPKGIRRIAASRAKKIAYTVSVFFVGVSALLLAVSIFGVPVSISYFIFLIGCSAVIELMRASIVACIVRDGEMQRLSFLVVADSAVALLSILSMLHFVGATAEAYILGYCFGRMASLGLAVSVSGDWNFFSYPRVTLDPVESRRVFEFNKGLLFLGQFGWVQSLIDRYLLAGVLGAQQVGYYTASSAVASRPFAVVSSLLTSIFRGKLAPSNHDDVWLSKARLHELQRWLGIVLLFSTASLLFVLVFGHVIVSLLLEKSYRASALVLLVPIAIAQSLSIACHAFDNVLLSIGRSKLLLGSQAALTPFSIAFIVLGASFFGLEGAAYGRVAFEFLHFAVLGILVLSIPKSGSSTLGDNG
jgi:O-antigen/teichoic acid export membrane protein